MHLIQVMLVRRPCVAPRAAIIEARVVPTTMFAACSRRIRPPEIPFRSYCGSEAQSREPPTD